MNSAINLNLGIYGLIITYTHTEDFDIDQAVITSDLMEDAKFDDNPTLATGFVKGLESLILAHHRAGVDVTDYRYIEGIELTVSQYLRGN